MNQNSNEKKKKIERRIELTKTILASIAVLSVVPLIAVAPGVIKIIEPFVGNKRRYRTPTYVKGVVGKLQRQGLIVVHHERGEAMARLTSKGARALLRYQMNSVVRKKQRWDGKWRVIIFDIQESHRRRRDFLRERIVHFGFLRLQDSVWLYPYNCEELVALIKADCHLGRELLSMTVEKIENDTWLKKKFNLL